MLEPNDTTSKENGASNGHVERNTDSSYGEASGVFMY